MFRWFLYYQRLHGDIISVVMACHGQIQVVRRFKFINDWSTMPRGNLVPYAITLVTDTRRTSTATTVTAHTREVQADIDWYSIRWSRGYEKDNRDDE
jgi:hypothetical protein